MVICNSKSKECKGCLHAVVHEPIYGMWEYNINGHRIKGLCNEIKCPCQDIEETICEEI